MTACQACHLAKVRCQREERQQEQDEDHDSPCQRCIRLNLVCVPHVSRQGQGPKKRQTIQSEDDCVLVHTAQAYGRHHYGIRYLVHMFVAVAATRRSWSLLNKACQLAQRSGIAMDEIFCPQSRPILDPILFPATSYREDDPPLTWSDIPPSPAKITFVNDKNNREQRYIFIRHVHDGRSRYLISQAFARDICSLSLIQETWDNNQQPVVSLFLPKDLETFTQALFYQVSRFRDATVEPECVRVPRLRVRMQSPQTSQNRVVQTMDMVLGVAIPNLRQSVVFMEFVNFLARLNLEHVQDNTHSNSNNSISNTTTKNNTADTPEADDAMSIDAMSLFHDLEDWTSDDDFQLFMDLMDNAEDSPVS